jgi:hypothetical protein
MAGSRKPTVHREQVVISVSVRSTTDVIAEADLMYRHEIANFKKPAIARALRVLADSLEKDG